MHNRQNKFILYLFFHPLSLARFRITARHIIIWSLWSKQTHTLRIRRHCPCVWFTFNIIHFHLNTQRTKQSALQCVRGIYCCSILLKNISCSTSSLFMYPLYETERYVRVHEHESAAEANIHKNNKYNNSNNNFSNIWMNFDTWTSQRGKPFKGAVWLKLCATHTQYIAVYTNSSA